MGTHIKIRRQALFAVSDRLSCIYFQIVPPLNRLSRQQTGIDLLTFAFIRAINGSGFIHVSAIKKDICLYMDTAQIQAGGLFKLQVTSPPASNSPFGEPYVMIAPG